MVILKSIAGSIAGAVGGVILYFVIGICLEVVAIFSSDLGKWMRSNRQYFWVGCIAIGAIIGFLVPIILESQRRAARDEEERKQRRAREAQAKQERDRAAAELERQKQQLANLLSTTQRDFLTIPELVPSADAHLDRAERDFADGAFAPFWDEIEHATNKLAAYQNGVRGVSRNADAYEQQASKLSVRVPKFSLPDGKLPDARPVAQRLSQIVRTAQRNFQFATIYEQRKTNQLLYAGFSSLGHAISSLGSVISSSLDDLSRSVQSSLEDLLRHADAESEGRRKYEKDHLAKEDELHEKVDKIWRGEDPPR
jgi:uncharacterized membrane protein